MAIAIFDFQIVRIRPKLAFQRSTNLEIVVVLLLSCSATSESLFRFLLLLVYLWWALHIDLSELGDLLLSFLPSLWVDLFLERLDELFGDIEAEISWRHESTHGTLPFEIHTCHGTGLTEDVLAG